LSTLHLRQYKDRLASSFDDAAQRSQHWCCGLRSSARQTQCSWTCSGGHRGAPGRPGRRRIRARTRGWPPTIAASAASFAGSNWGCPYLWRAARNVQSIGWDAVTSTGWDAAHRTSTIPGRNAVYSTFGWDAAYSTLGWDAARTTIGCNARTSTIGWDAACPTLGWDAACTTFGWDAACSTLFGCNAACTILGWNAVRSTLGCNAARTIIGWDAACTTLGWNAVRSTFG
jgi:hypothetical protein